MFNFLKFISLLSKRIIPRKQRFAHNLPVVERSRNRDTHNGSYMQASAPLSH